MGPKCIFGVRSAIMLSRGAFGTVSSSRPALNCTCRGRKTLKQCKGLPQGTDKGLVGVSLGFTTLRTRHQHDIVCRLWPSHLAGGIVKPEPRATTQHLLLKRYKTRPPFHRAHPRTQKRVWSCPVVWSTYSPTI